MNIKLFKRKCKMCVTTRLCAEKKIHREEGSAEGTQVCF